MSSSFCVFCLNIFFNFFSYHFWNWSSSSTAGSLAGGEALKYWGPEILGPECPGSRRTLSLNGMSRGASRAPWLLDDAAEAERLSSLFVESQVPPPNRIRSHLLPHVPVPFPEHVLNLLELLMLEYVRNCVCNSRRLPKCCPKHKIYSQISFVSQTACFCIGLHFPAEPV